MDQSVGFRLHVTEPAREDMVAIVRWSDQEFGRDAALRYRSLIRQSLIDVRSDPQRPGSRRDSDLDEEFLVYHLRFSRERARTSLGIVRNPRHCLAYYVDDSTVIVVRILHDSRELWRHVPAASD